MSYDLVDIKKAYDTFKVGTVVLYEYDNAVYLCEVVHNTESRLYSSNHYNIVGNDLMTFNNHDEVIGLSDSWNIIEKYLESQDPSFCNVRFLDISGLTFDEWREQNAEYFI